MSTSQYYVSREGKQLGPYPLNSIVEMVKKNELTMLDYLYDDKAGDWVLLMEHRELADQLKDHKPAKPPKAGEAAAPTPKTEVAANGKQPDGQPNHMVVEWYILKGENKFGPFSYTDVVKMLQNKVVFEFDFAWHPGMSTWVRVADLDPFKPDHIGKMKETLMPEISEVFFRRRHRRVRYGGTILVHDNKAVWKGKGVEISAGGAGVVMENSMVVPGQTLYLHFKPGDGVPPFNAICEVVSKQYVEGVKDKNAPIRYGLKFTSISPTTQKFLQEFAKRSEAA